MKEEKDKILDQPHLKEGVFRLQELFFGFAPPTVIGTAARLNLFPALERPASAEEIAQGLNLSRRGVERLLNALAALGILTPDKGRFALSVEYAPLLSPSSPLYLGDFFAHATVLQENWIRLPEVVATGMPLDRKREPSFFATLARGLFAVNWFPATELAERYTPPSGRVLDVAGGSGVWSIALLRQHPNLDATVLDLPPVVEDAAIPTIERLGLSDRYSFIKGNLFEVPWGEGYSSVVLGHICHSFGKEGIAKILETAKKALAPYGEVVIVDFLMDNQDPFPHLFSINMLVATEEGGVYSKEEYASLAEGAGMKVKEFIPFSSPWSSGAMIVTPKA